MSKRCTETIGRGEQARNTRNQKETGNSYNGRGLSRDNSQERTAREWVMISKADDHNSSRLGYVGREHITLSHLFLVRVC